MASTSSPYGMRPVYHPSGQVTMVTLQDGIASGLSSDIYMGQPVKMTTSGTITPVTSTSDAFVGVFWGCYYTPPGGLPPVISNYWPANATYVAGTCRAFFYNDPAIVYQIQADGSVAQTAIGDQTTLTNLTANNGLGNSLATASSTLVGVGVQGQLRIMNKDLYVNNAWGDAYTDLYVTIARHQFVYPQTAI